uniref:PDZ domain-containing protein n=1 Tax=Strigamia maritima TaxID=126957 RepID=T1J115_STRMM
MDGTSNTPAPRLCHLVKWPDFDGYGFNLHAEKNKPGQFIGKVDEKSPAQAAGLNPGDRIIEVNNVNIANENHKQVVERIKAVPGETKLLVVDDNADKYYKERKMVVKHTMSNVVHIKTPASKKEYEAILGKERSDSPEPVNNGVKEDGEAVVKNESVNNEGSSDKLFNGSTGESNEEIEVLPVKESLKVESPVKESPKVESLVKESPKVESLVKESPKVESPVKESPKLQKEILNAPKASPKPSPKPDVSERSKLEKAENSTSNGSMMSSTNGSIGVRANGQDMLNLNMSAQEMRELIASRSKNRYDPRKETMDLKKKYAIVQSM